MKRMLNLHDSPGLDPQIKHSPLIVRKVTFPAEPFTFQVGKLRFKIQRTTPLIYV